MALISLRRLKLETRMVLVLGLVALLQTIAIGMFALHYLSQSLEEQMGQRSLQPLVILVPLLSKATPSTPTLNKSSRTTNKITDR